MKGTGGHPMEYSMVPWGHGWTVGHTCWECPVVPWDHGMGSGMHTRLREGQLDIPWNVPRSHETVGGWDGLCDTHI